MSADLFVTQKLKDRSQPERSLLDTAIQLRNRLLQVPYFQRELCWDDRKIRGWFETVISGDAIGVIVTYQLREPVSDGHYPIWLADGLQRLSATLAVIESPRKYGFGFGTDQAETHAKSFDVVIQHRIYDSHLEAYQAFQNLNQGTAATPAEFYKGRITETPMGRFVYERVPEIVLEIGAHFTKKVERRTREASGKRVRVSLALFYQYATNSSNTRLWNANSSAIRPDIDDPIESRIGGWLADRGDEEVRTSIADFRRFIEGQAALIRNVLEDEKGRGAAMTVGLYLTMLATAIWRRNVRASVEWQDALFREILKHTQGNTTTLILLDPDPRSVVFNTCDLTKVLAFAEEVGLSVATPRRASAEMARGYDNSHHQPFSVNGDGTTEPEPAPLNRARGAHPMLLSGRA